MSPKRDPFVTSWALNLRDLVKRWEVPAKGISYQRSVDQASHYTTLKSVVPTLQITWLLPSTSRLHQNTNAKVTETDQSDTPSPQRGMDMLSSASEAPGALQDQADAREVVLSFSIHFSHLCSIGLILRGQLPHL